jgi:hypothetical protein
LYDSIRVALLSPAVRDVLSDSKGNEAQLHSERTMSPSQIVKSAYVNATSAGYQKSLKTFARQVCDEHFAAPSPSLLRACELWLNGKEAQRKQARQCARSQRRGHVDVHQIKQARSVEHCIDKGTPFALRTGAQP